MLRRLLVTGALAALVAVPASAAPRFRVVDLGFFPGGVSAGPVRFGPDRTIVGWCDLPGSLGSHAISWAVGPNGDPLLVTDLVGLAGSDWAGARGANGAGWVVGFSNTADPQPRGVLWRDGGIIDLDSGADGNANIYANDVNDAGVICGFLTKSGGGGGWDAVVWTEQATHPGRFDRALLPYHPLADAQFSWTEAWTISATGRVLGRTNLGLSGGDRATLWEADAARTPVLLEPLANSNQSMPGDLNDAGDAVGSTMYPFGLDHPTRWSRDAAHVPSELPLWPGYNEGHATAVDATGDLVLGSSSLVSTATFPPVTLETRVVLWQDGAIWDLNQRLDDSGAGWTIMSGDDLNGDGWIAAGAVRSGVPHAVLLIPVPDVSGVDPGAAARVALAVPRPNPSWAEVRVWFSLPTGGATRLRVLDAQGRGVATPFDGMAGAGRQEVVWSGNDAAGKRVAPGLYFMELETPAGRAVTRLAHVR